jgi:hypothetical protein
MSLYKIPLTPAPQTFNINLADKEYRLTVRWNASHGSESWSLDIATADRGEPILSGIPIVTGVDLLGPYEYLNFGGALVCYSGSSDTAPTFDNLGTENELLFVVDDNG